jgi:hypothetical protein
MINKGNLKMISYSAKNIYWNYFISIEEDLARLSRFVEFDQRNEDTFSIELVRLLISSSSEFEVVAKELCSIKDPSKIIKNIDDIRETLISFYNDIFNLEITVSRFGLKYKPLSNWETGRNCDWWRSYNSVKHQRNSNYENANLKNVINSIGALYIVNLYYYNALQESEKGSIVNMEETTLVLKPRPCLIKINRNDFYMIPYNDAYVD